MEGDDKPLVAIPCRRRQSEGGEASSLGINTLDITLTDAVRSESIGISNREEDVGIQTNFNNHNGQQADHQDRTDLSPHRGVQLSINCTRAKNGGPRALLDSNAREGSIWGNDEMNRMEFEGVSKSPTSY